jgi:transcriptional regulator with XRE-family HTH domain
MTQTVFAEKVGVSVAMLHNYSNGSKEPTLTPFLNMCRELRTTPVELAKALGKDVTGVPNDE